MITYEQCIEKALIDFTREKWYNQVLEEFDPSIPRLGVNVDDLRYIIFCRDSLTKVTKFAENIYYEFVQINLKCTHLMVKPRGFGSFKILVILAEQTYFSDLTKQAHSIIRKYKSGLDALTFIYVSMMDNSNNVNFELIKNDGYCLEYQV